jgi:hypothetical protein
MALELLKIGKVPYLEFQEPFGDPWFVMGTYVVRILLPADSALK